MDKYKNKYRIPSARLQTWDYGRNGAYFITICTKNRVHYFGEIVVQTPKLVETPKLGVSTMIPTEIGNFAEQFWLEIPNHYPFIELGNFVVMPNLVHGILIIDKNENGAGGSDGSDGSDGPLVETPNLGVSTIENAKNAAANENATTTAASKKWKPNTIGSIVNQYKRICTIHARKINAGFEWQTRYYDHIIRDSGEFERIQNYIANNPQNWKDDKFYA
jgi:REP element-mobilizing transposase RayT